MNDTVSQPWVVDTISPPELTFDRQSREIKINSPPDLKVKELQMSSKYKNLKKSEMLLRKM